MGEWFATAASFFVVGAIGFWIAAFAVAILVMIFEETEQEVKAFVTLIIAILFFEWVGNLGAFSYIGNHFLQFLGYVAGYFAVGVAWSLAKWWFHLDDLREKIQRGEIKVTHTVGRAGESRDELNDQYFQKAKDGTAEIKLEGHRNRILCWMTYWPWSLLYALFNDVIRRVFRFIYNRMQGIYRKIAHRMLGDLLNAAKASEPSRGTRYP